jgi:GDP-L-fucose synthase
MAGRSATLVTGGHGFLGRHLLARLRESDPEVLAPRRAEVDLTDARATADLFDACRPRTVYHLAAEVGGIGANRENPGRFWFANLAMGMNILEQSRLHSVERLVMVGTICSYPKHAPVPFREESLWDGYPEETNAPYGVAKKALLVGAQAYAAQYGLDSVTVLPVNLYGPGDDFELATSHVIPALIRRMIEAGERGDRTVTLWGDGSPTREFLYVEDAARGIHLAGICGGAPDPVNLGTGVETPIRDLVAMIAEATAFDGEIAWDTAMPNGQPRRRLDTTRAAERYGFAAEVPLTEGIRRTVAWYRANR